MLQMKYLPCTVNARRSRRLNIEWHVKRARAQVIYLLRKELFGYNQQNPAGHQPDQPISTGRVFPATPTLTFLTAGGKKTSSSQRPWFPVIPGFDVPGRKHPILTHWPVTVRVTELPPPVHLPQIRTPVWLAVLVVGPEGRNQGHWDAEISCFSCLAATEGGVGGWGVGGKHSLSFYYLL